MTDNRSGASEDVWCGEPFWVDVYIRPRILPVQSSGVSTALRLERKNRSSRRSPNLKIFLRSTCRMPSPGTWIRTSGTRRWARFPTSSSISRTAWRCRGMRRCTWCPRRTARRPCSTSARGTSAMLGPQSVGSQRQAVDRAQSIEPKYLGNPSGTCHMPGAVHFFSLLLRLLLRLRLKSLTPCHQ